MIVTFQTAPAFAVRDCKATRQRAAARHAVPALAVLLLGAATLPDAPDDLKSFIAEAERVQKMDIAAWSRFSFHRRHLKEYLDEGGHSARAQSLEFLVTPAVGGFDELLVKVDGRAPTAGEVGKRRREAKFSRHYSMLLAGDTEDDEEGAYSLGALFRLASYSYAGRESIDRVDCYRLDFSPDASKVAGGVAGRFAEAMEGSLWVSVDGLHLLRARARTIRPIPLAMSLSKVHELVVSLDTRAVAPGIYLPRQIELRTDARILLMTTRQRNTYVYSSFMPVATF